MESPREKWQQCISKIIPTNTPRDSIISSASEESDGNQRNEIEVEAYFQRLKSKTNMKNLWSGKIYHDIVEGDRTPEISTESDGELDLKMTNTLKNLRQIQLDSDEDEMRKDYIREGNFNKSNNDGVEHSTSSDESLHLMDNVHFAELEINEVDLTDSIKTEKLKDFLPQLHSTKFAETSTSDSKSFHSVNYQGLSKLHSAEGSSLEHVSKSLGEEIEKPKSFTNEIEEDGDSMPSEIQSIQSSHPESTTNSASKSMTNSASKSMTNSASKGMTNSKSERVCSHGRTSNNEIRYIKNHSNSSSSSPSKHSRHSTSSKSSLSKQTRSLTSSKHTGSSIESEHASTASALKELASESSISNTLDSHSKKRLSNRSKSASSSSTSSSRRSSTRSARTVAKSQSKRNHEKHLSKRKEREKHKQKDAETQTKGRPEDNKTNELINFRYDWQRRDPNSIAVHVIDPVTIDVLTSYNPSVLAANDLMKFHMHLLQQHIENSRRLYESYSNVCVNNNYKYTTVEDTRKYIERNKPKVITYEEALRRVKKE